MTAKNANTANIFKNMPELNVGTVLVTNRGWSMVLPTFYRIVARTESSIWTKEIASISQPSDQYGQQGHKLADLDDDSWKIDRRACNRYSIKNKSFASIDGHYAKIWDGTPQYYDYMD